MKKLCVLSVLLIALFLVPSQSFALSCVELPSIDKSFEQYEGVIVGKVDSIETVTTNYDSTIGGKVSRKEMKITVLTSYKGIKERQLIATEDITWGFLEKDKEYLIFLNETDGNWEVPLCSPTAETTHSEKNLEFLAGKEEIQLLDNQIKDNPLLKKDGEVSTLVIMISAIILLLVGSIYFKKHKKRSN